MNRIVEICCGSWLDCVMAQQGGAQRIELNSALHLGGLTPSLAALQLAKQKTNLQVIAMVRPRAAGFCYNQEEFEEIQLTAKQLLEQGADGLAFGFLHEDGTMDKERTAQLTKMVHHYGKEAVFHRAFDCVCDPDAVMQELIELRVDRVLTSGQREKAIEGIDLLKRLHSCYGHAIQIVAGSGMNAENAAELCQKTGITQVHSSCKGWLIDKTTSMNHVSYAYHDTHDYEFVDPKKVAALVKAMNQLD